MLELIFVVIEICITLAIVLITILVHCGVWFGVACFNIMPYVSSILTAWFIFVNPLNSSMKSTIDNDPVVMFILIAASIVAATYGLRQVNWLKDSFTRIISATSLVSINWTLKFEFYINTPPRCILGTVAFYVLSVLIINSNIKAMHVYDDENYQEIMMKRTEPYKQIFTTILDAMTLAIIISFPVVYLWEPIVENQAVPIVLSWISVAAAVVYGVVSIIMKMRVYGEAQMAAEAALEALHSWGKEI